MCFEYSPWPYLKSLDNPEKACKRKHSSLFDPLAKSEDNKVLRPQGCHSPVGRQRGSGGQVLSLGEFC
jgi:hypothetical protein